MGITSSTTVNATEGWQTVNLTSPVSVTTGQTVWLAYVFENSVGIRYEVGTPGRALSSDTWTSGMPGTFGVSTNADYNYSLYCTYTTVNMAKSAEFDLPQAVSIDSLQFREIETPVFESSELKVYPNPFNTRLNFEFTTENDAYALLEIFNLNGQSIARLLEQQVQAGVMNRIEYIPSEIIAGIYIYRLTLDGNVMTGKVIYKN